MEAVVFVGIQAAGKSTFYEQRFQDTHAHINLDLLKTRRRELRMLEECIRARQPFVVDNTNVLEEERARYIGLAKQAGYSITGYYFQSTLKDALRRNQQRQGKEVIPVRGVIVKYRRLQPPRYEEGFDQLYVVTINAQNQFVVQDWIQPDFPENTTV